MKILVVIPHNRHISNHTLRSLDKIKDGDGLEFRFSSHHGGMYVADNRNDQCYDKDGLLAWPDAFLFVDSDMEFELAYIHSLASRDVEICSGAYCYKETAKPEFIVAGMWLPGFPGMAGRKPDFHSDDTKGCFPVDWVGAGFLLVKKTAMQKMPYPWFYHPVMPVPPGAGPFPQKAAGEDVGFCLRAMEAGVKVYLDADIRIGHKKENTMPEGKTELIGDISGIVMGINKALIQVAEDYRKLYGYAKALNAENETLKEELKKLKV